MASVKEIADFLGLELSGFFKDVEITGAASLDLARSGEVSLCRSGLKDKLDILKSSEASLVIVDNDVDLPLDFSIPYIKSDNARLSFIRILNKYFVKKYQAGIHKSAVISECATISKNVVIGAYVTIGGNVIIGENSVIHSGVHIYDNVKIGNNVVIHSGTIIGCDGFGFERTSDNYIEKFPHIGGVEIHDNVEIMASVHISRGTLANTIVKEETKIDSGCHIAHNVIIGKRCLLTAHVMIAGSTTIGDNVYIAPSSSVINKIEIGNNAFIGMSSFINKDIPANAKAWGVPAKIKSD